MSKTYLKVGIGEISMVKTIFLGAETNTSQLIVDLVGLMDPLAQLQIELILLETELGLI